MLYSCNKAGNKKCYEENYKKEKIQDYTVLIKKNPRVSEPTKFKPMVLKGQLYVSVTCIYVCVMLITQLMWSPRRGSIPRS